MNSLCLLSLESANPYIRYLASKNYVFNFDWSKHLDEKARKMIENDSHHLMKNLHLEKNYSSLD